MTDNEFARMVEFMYSRYGIDLNNKRVIVSGRLDNYIISKGYSNYGEYMDCIEKDFTGKETQNLVNILTTNHTYFMREFEHMEFLRDVILPEFKVKESGTRDLRIWSAASSSGEEAYTIAMIIKDFLGIDYMSWETTILATDISDKVLVSAIKGIYQKEQIEGLPNKWILSNFIRINSEQFQVKNEIRKHVLFRQFNLMSAFPFKKKMHVVFLRNVMIYFDNVTKRKLLEKIYDFMEPGGYLIIGSTESIDRGDTLFQYVRPSIFKKI